MEKTSYKNSVEITGNISSISDIRTKANGKQYMYINIAQNSRDGKASFYPIYLDGVMLEKFKEQDLKVGNRITTTGKLESYQKDSKQTLQIRPFDLQKVEFEKNKETNQSYTKPVSQEIDM